MACEHCCDDLLENPVGGSNRKVGPENKVSFDTSAGPPGVGGTCIAVSGGCKYCYATAQQKVMASFGGMCAANATLAFLDPEKYADFAISDIRGEQARRTRLRRRRYVAPYKLIRIHGFGDFFSTAHLRAWLRIVRTFPELKFFGTTRTWRLHRNKGPSYGAPGRDGYVPDRLAFLATLDELRSEPNVFLGASIDETTRDQTMPDHCPDGGMNNVEWLRKRGWNIWNALTDWGDADERERDGGPPVIQGDPHSKSHESALKARRAAKEQGQIAEGLGKLLGPICYEQTGEAKNCSTCMYCAQRGIMVTFAYHKGHSKKETPARTKAFDSGYLSNMAAYGLTVPVGPEGATVLVTPLSQDTRDAQTNLWPKSEKRNPMDEDDYQATCPVCGGEGTVLGELGSLVHFRCRACGMDFNRSAQLENPRVVRYGLGGDKCAYDGCEKKADHEEVQKASGMGFRAMVCAEHCKCGHPDYPSIYRWKSNPGQCGVCGDDSCPGCSATPDAEACDVVGNPALMLVTGGNPAEFEPHSGHLKGGGGTDYCDKCKQMRYVTFGLCGPCIAHEIAVGKQGYIQGLIDQGLSLHDAEHLANDMDARYGRDSANYWRNQEPFGGSLRQRRDNPRYRIGDEIMFVGPRLDARDPPEGSRGTCKGIRRADGKVSCHPDPAGRMVYADWPGFGESSVWVRATQSLKRNPSLMLITGNPGKKSVENAWARFHQADFRGPVETMPSIHGVPEILFAVGRLVTLEVNRKLSPRGGTIWVACSPDDQGLWLLAKNDTMDLNGSQGEAVKALTYDPPKHSGKEKDAVFRHEFKKPHPVLAPVGHANRCKAALLEGGVYRVDDWLYD